MAAERELIYRIKVVADPENGKALREHVSAAKRAEESIVSMRSENLRKAVVEAKLARSQEESALRQAAQDRVRILRASEDLERRQREQSRSDARQHIDRTEKAWLESQRRIRGGQAAVVESISGTTESIARLIRGVAMIGVVGESSSEKLLRNLVKIQAGFDVLVGSTRLVQGLGRGAGAVASLLGGSGGGGRAATPAAMAMLAGGISGGGFGVENAFTLGPGGAASSLASGALTNVGEFGAGRITSRLTKSKAAKNLISETLSTIVGDTLGEIGSEAVRKKLGKKATSEAGGKVFEAVVGGVMQKVTMRNLPNRSVGGLAPTMLRYAEGDSLWRKAGGALAEAGAGGLGGNYFNRVPGMGGGDFTRFGATQGVASRVTAAGMRGGVGMGAAAAMGGKGFLAGAGSLGGLGAFAAFAASMTLMGKVIHETATGTQNDAKSWSNSIAKFELQIGKSIASAFGEKNLVQVEKWAKVMDVFTGGLPVVSNIVGGGAAMARSEAALAKLESSSARTGGQRLRAEALNEARQASEAELRGVTEGRLSRFSGQAKDPREQLRRIADEQQFNAAAIRGGGGSADEQARLFEKMAELTDRRASVERQLIAEQRTSVQERIAAAEKEVESLRQRIQINKDSLKSSAERFADLSSRDKARAIGAIQQARTSGAESLTREQRNLLRSVGGRDAEAAASDSAMAEAKRTDFFKFFGGSEGKDIAKDEAAAKNLSMKLTDDRKLIVQIERDDDRIAAVAAQSIAKAMDERDKILIKKIQDAQESATRAIAQTADSVFQSMWQQQVGRQAAMPK